MSPIRALSLPAVAGEVGLDAVECTETIRLLMRELGLVACQPRPWRPTTTVAGDAASTPDLLWLC